MGERCPRGHDITKPHTVYLWVGRRRCRPCRTEGRSVDEAAIDPAVEGSRRCRLCGENKPLDEFPTNGTRRRTACKGCYGAGATASVGQFKEWGRRGGRRRKTERWPTWIDLDQLAAAMAAPSTGRWWDNAPCAGQTDLFYPAGQSGKNEAQANEAKQVCVGCPASYQCLADALVSATASSDFGVWGGTVAEERAQLRRAVRDRRAVGSRP